mmetsp:Transcript_60303/g.152932  ORF Transcript_60303/g.152932 Transcript_60303/m.152932 type:complete len:204 (+) Transcript_60303:1445-2056(+)
MGNELVEVVKFRWLHPKGRLQLDAWDLREERHHVLPDACSKEPTLAHGLIKLHGGVIAGLFTLGSLRPQDVVDERTELQAEGFVALVVVRRLPAHPEGGLAVGCHVDAMRVCRGLHCPNLRTRNGTLQELRAVLIQHLGFVHGKELLRALFACKELEDAGAARMRPLELCDIVHLAINHQPHVLIRVVSGDLLQCELWESSHD